MNNFRWIYSLILINIPTLIFQQVGPIKSKTQLNNYPINLISRTGIVVNNDTFLLNNITLREFLSRLDTLSNKIKIKYNYQNISEDIINSPPPRDTINYPNENTNNNVYEQGSTYTDFFGVLYSDNIEIMFYNSKKGLYKSFPLNLDSILLFHSIEIKSPRKAIVNNNIAIGDSYIKLFNLYAEPKYINNLKDLNKEYSFDDSRLTFILENNKASNNFGKIIGIKLR